MQYPRIAILTTTTIPVYLYFANNRITLFTKGLSDLLKPPYD